MTEDSVVNAEGAKLERTELEAYLRGDAGAFRGIYRRHASRILSVAVGWGVDRSAAEDIVQSTFLKFHQSRDRVRVERPLAPWLVTIALNLLRDRARKSRHHVDPVMEESQLTLGDAPDAELEARETAARLQARLVGLPEAQREAVVAVRLGGLSYGEAAALLGRSEAAIRQNVHRGLARLLRAGEDDVPRLAVVAD